ncbi:MAG: hypothetical protein KDN19_11700 [Verrucomicrobiae bacterium]|nr:hypothetical protein [Verrucomicrobiae bacterium]
MFAKKTPFLARTTPRSFVVLAAIALSLAPTFAILDEALNLAFEAAIPYIEQGFEVREDTWSGEIPSGEPKLVRHQMFRGNEYWFWLATSFDDCELKLEIFDGEGNPVGIESFTNAKTAGVRVLPSKTGTYFIRVTVKSKDDRVDLLDWGLVYGYR